MLKTIVKTQILSGDLKKHVRNFKKDTDGASLIEYSILIGIITAAVIATVVLVGGKVSAAWTNLNTNWT